MYEEDSEEPSEKQQVKVWNNLLEISATSSHRGESLGFESTQVNCLREKIINIFQRVITVSNHYRGPSKCLAYYKRVLHTQSEKKIQWGEIAVNRNILWHDPDSGVNKDFKAAT